MATPSASIVETLIGAIPVEEGAALVARVGERATITAKSGSAEVGSVALTVEAMDDLIAQVLPPDQLESLQENGTVHFEFTPPAIGGEFAVLAASTPGDRWLEIRRRNTATAPPAPRVTGAVRPAPAPTAPAAPAAAPAPVPAPAAAVASPVSDEAEVAHLLSRFHSPEPAVPVADLFAATAAPEPTVLPPSFTRTEPVVATDFDLSATVPARAPSIDRPPAPAVPDASTNDDLTLPANLDFTKARSDFDLDGLSLPDALPEGPAFEGLQGEPPSADSDHVRMGGTEASGMAKSRSVVLLSVVLGLVVLSAGGWFAVERYLWAPVDVVVPPPPPRKPVQPEPKAAVARTPSSPATTTSAAKPGANAVAQRPAAAPPALTRVTPPAVAKTSAPTPATQGSVAAAAKTAAPAAFGPREGFAIQVAAVHEREEADRIVARLISEGYSGYAIRGQGAAAAYYRVRVGAFKDRQTAEEVAARLERAEGVKPWIVKETP